MELYIIIFVLINIGSLRMIQFLKNKEVNNEPQNKWEHISLIVSSLFGGAFGIIVGILALDFKKDDKKFLLVNIVLLILNIFFLKQLMGG